MALGELTTAAQVAADLDHQAAALAAFGMRLEGDGALAGPEPFYLWPENVEAWGLWGDVQTQWRVGMAGATGLDYAGVRAYLEMKRVRRPREKFKFIVAMEHAALDAYGEQRRKADRKKTGAPLQ